VVRVLWGRRFVMGIVGVSHVTLAVADVGRSVVFYRDVLGCRVRAVWDAGAYVEAGSLWLCLSRDEAVRGVVRADYTHVAFEVSEAAFGGMAARIGEACVLWKENGSEGASVYFLDPDGHKLEIHVGSLESRLAHYRANPGKGVRVLEGEETGSLL